MNTKLPLSRVFAGLALLLLAMLFVDRAVQHTPGIAKPQLETTASSAERLAGAAKPADRPTPLALGPVGQTLPGFDPTKDWTRRLFSNSIESIRLIETLKSAVPVAQRGVRDQLDGLSKKLFIDDWKLAAMYDAELDPSAAQRLFAEITNRVGQNNGVDYEGLLGESRRTEVPAIPPDPQELLKDYYEPRVTSTAVPDFKRVSDVVATLAPGEDPMQSGVLKDAWVYVALNTELAQWESDRAQIQQEDLAKFEASPDAATPDYAAHKALLDAHSAGSLAAMRTSNQTAAGIYSQVFEWRFREIYGLTESSDLVAQLAGLTLSGASTADFELPSP
jgi:hypothetical protein